MILKILSSASICCSKHISLCIPCLLPLLSLLPRNSHAARPLPRLRDQPLPASKQKSCASQCTLESRCRPRELSQILERDQKLSEMIFLATLYLSLLSIMTMYYLITRGKRKATDREKNSLLRVERVICVLNCVRAATVEH